MVALKHGAALFTAVIVMLGAATAAAQLRARARPLVTKFTGVFQPYDKQAAGALQTLTFTNKSDTWLFLVERVDVMGGSPNSGNLLLSRIFPPRLAISGSTVFIASLKKPDMMGKRLSLQGWLDLRVKTFRIAEVKEEPAGAPQGQSTQQAPSQPDSNVPAEPLTTLPFQHVACASPSGMSGKVSRTTP